MRGSVSVSVRNRLAGHFLTHQLHPCGAWHGIPRPQRGAAKVVGMLDEHFNTDIARPVMTRVSRVATSDLEDRHA
jgi:hypothetical protein